MQVRLQVELFQVSDDRLAIPGCDSWRFRFRGLSPVIGGIPLGLHARKTEAGLDLWSSQTGVRAMSAQAEAE